MGVLKTLPEIYFWRDKCSIQFPGIFSVQQMTLIVVRYIEAHPERMNIPFLILAEDAFARTHGRAAIDTAPGRAGNATKGAGHRRPFSIAASPQWQRLPNRPGTSRQRR